MILGSDGQLLTVASTSKAAQATLYCSAGRELSLAGPGDPGAIKGSYIAPVNIRHQAATTGTSAIWHMRNSGVGAGRADRVWCVRRMLLTVTFDGTAAAGTRIVYRINRYGDSGIYLNLGPTENPITAICKATRFGPTAGYSPTIGSTITNLDAAQIDGTSTSALTSSGMVTYSQDTAIELDLPISVSSTIKQYNLTFEPTEYQIRPSQGLVIRIGTTNAVVGQGICGCVEWDERLVS